MELRIIGVECKSGSFTSQSTGQMIDYNNIYLYGVRSLPETADNRLSIGEASEVIKIKNDKDVVRSVFNSEMTSKDFTDMIGKEYGVFYDKNGKLEMVIPLSPASKKGA